MKNTGSKTNNTSEIKHDKGHKVPLSSRLSVQRDAVFDLLKQLAIDNEVYFHQIGSASVYNKRIADCCEELSASIDPMRNLVHKLQGVSRKCDYDEDTPGNGFRFDYIYILLSANFSTKNLVLWSACSEGRGLMMFRLAHHCKEIESYAATLRFLILALQQVISSLEMLDGDSLFPPLEGDYQKYNIIFRGIETLDGSCFYGRPLGFQFCPSVTRIFRVIGLVLATYSLSWESGTAAISSIINSGKMLLNPEQRAKRIMQVTREADIGFCRGFWNLSELPMPKLFCPSMAVCEISEIKPAGPMPLETTDGGTVFIPEPSSHTGVRPVSVKILSFSHRVGLSATNASNRLPLSPHIVVHCHGGGYVATSSKSHETYLRSWAKSLNCPIVSIDYSLAPENPFPRPTEEVVYAYAWMLNNPEKFGWTGERICMVGDSAGGNLVVSVCLKLVELEVKRLPDGLVPVYTPFLFQYLPSPSRVLSFMDPLLHMGVVIRCAAAYTGSYTDEELDRSCTYHNKSTARASGNGHRSLQDYVDQVQKVHRGSILDFTQGSQSIVSLINLSLLNKSVAEKSPTQLDFSTANDSTGSNSKSTEMINVTVETEGEDRMEEAEREVVVAAVEEAEEDLLEEEEVDSPDQTIQTVRVNSDPFNIYLSSTNFDQCLIDYLQMHPITKSSVHNFANDNGEQVDSEHNQVEDSAEMEDVFSDGTRTITVPRSATTGSLSSYAPSGGLNRSPVSLKSPTADNYSTPESYNLTGASRQLYFSAGSSIGRTPMYSKKRLSRNKCRSLSQSLADTAALAAGHAMDNLSDWLDAPMEPLGHSDKKKLTRAVTLSPHKAARLHQKEAESYHSHFTELLKLKLPRDHLMSPMYATKELLAKMPPFRFVACHLDPLLDDTVVFAKRVRDSGGCVASLDVLDSLPHGFLNFAPMSTDCRDGANLCMERIRETLGMS